MDLDHLATSFQNQLNVRFGLTDPEALLIERLLFKVAAPSTRPWLPR
jgi:hypothetical protein